LSGIATSTSLGDTLRILAVVDGDSSIIWEVPGASFAARERFTFSFTPWHYQITEGRHTVAFHAVNGEGSVSQPVPWSITVFMPTPVPVPEAGGVEKAALIAGISVAALVVVGLVVLGVIFCVRRGVCHRASAFHGISWLKIDPALKAELTLDNAERLI
jgi:hypothetical protein